MQRTRWPYGARSEEERQRNLARLGRWQENTTPEQEPTPTASWWDGFFWGWLWGAWK
jgi:hypothetical protein